MCRGRKAGEGREQKAVKDSRVRTCTVGGRRASEGFHESMHRGFGVDEIWRALRAGADASAATGRVKGSKTASSTAGDVLMCSVLRAGK